MSVNRFSWFLSHLHINENLLAPKRNEPNFDKLYKVRPLLDPKHFFSILIPLSTNRLMKVR
jgi:hypothetical protein